MSRVTRRGTGAVAALMIAVMAAGCAARADRGGFNCDRRWGAGTAGGAITGALIGGGLGGGIVATSGETERQWEDYATGIGAGVIGGALIGGLFGHCAFDPQHEEAVPPPTPVPPPPPPPAPPVTKKIILRGVNFDFDKATIRPDASAVLEEAARTLNEEPSIDVSVEGHTDAMGTDAYNQRLSEARAAAVRARLVELGVNPSRLSARGFGESEPVASNATDEGRAQNRRVELKVVGP
jgi:OOP family OmpA-OmpF porin